ncbi:hypothetical protein [Microbispora sp. NBC_01389]|uniref:hypothetical protein n=1 Tax=Microbispora sp. NBC_01389 TaxID=2903584 RepID=UPI003246AECD
MTLSDHPAERHRQVAGLFTERVNGARVEVPGDADAQTRLLGFVGRDPFWPGR